MRLHGLSFQQQGAECCTIYTDLTANVSPCKLASSCVFSRSAVLSIILPFMLEMQRPTIPAACRKITSMWMVLLQTYGLGERGS